MPPLNVQEVPFEESTFQPVSTTACQIFFTVDTKYCSTVRSATFSAEIIHGTVRLLNTQNGAIDQYFHFEKLINSLRMRSDAVSEDRQFSIIDAGGG